MERHEGSAAGDRARRLPRRLDGADDDEPGEMVAPLDPFGPDDEDEAPTRVPSWLGAAGQMVAAFLAVVAVVALFIGTAAVLRRLLP